MQAQSARRRCRKIAAHLRATNIPSLACVAMPTGHGEPSDSQELARTTASSRQIALFEATTESQVTTEKLRITKSILYKAPQLSDTVGKLQSFPNSFRRTRDGRGPLMSYNKFISNSSVVLLDIVRRGTGEVAHGFLRAGARETIVWAPGEVKAAIVTCGGLCPGMNNVICEIFNTLHYNYGVDCIYGIRSGLGGFWREDLKRQSWTKLTPMEVSGKDKVGGSFIGSGRGGYHESKILDECVAHGVNQLYIIGGDGTHRAAHALFQQVKKRGIKFAIVGVPKTIDNDIGIIDRSFGFDSAVEAAQLAIESAHIEASSAFNGIGVVKLMGRHAGYISAHSTLASSQVDLCLIPEEQFRLEGVLEHIETVLGRQHRCVVVVAEGAGDHLLSKGSAKDAGGNLILPEIGVWLTGKIEAYLKKRLDDFTIKYHDPSYMIRSVPANAADSVYCMVIGQNAVHGAMAGFTGFTSGLCNNRTVMIPMDAIGATSPAYLNARGRTWERVVSLTHQPKWGEQSVS